MAPGDTLTNKILNDWSTGRVRLWMTSLRDCPEEFGPWAGLVRLCAESFVGEWQPQRDDLARKLSTLPIAELGGEAQTLNEVLLPLIGDAFEADLVARAVPKDVARRARDLFSVEPPIAQWKI